MEDQATGGRGGVDVFGQRPKPAAALFDDFHNIEKITQRPGKAVVLGDDDHISRAELIEELAELGAFPGRAADFV